MSELDRQLEAGDVIVGECRCSPSKKGIVEVVAGGGGVPCLRIPEGYRFWDDTSTYFLSDDKDVSWPKTVEGALGFLTGGGRYTNKLHRDYHNWKHIPKDEWARRVQSISASDIKVDRCTSGSTYSNPQEHIFPKSDFKVIETDKEIRVTPKSRVMVNVDVFFVANSSWASHKYVLVKFVIESEKCVSLLRVSVAEGRVCEWSSSNRRGSSYQGYSDGDLLYLHFNQIDGALKTHKETEPILLPLTFYQDNIEDIKTALREYLEQ